MTASSVQEPSEWDEDPAWSRPDPMTAAEREAWLDRLCDAGESSDEEDWEDFASLTADELAEVEKAAGDELLAVEAATTGRRGPGQPGSARTSWLMRWPSPAATPRTYWVWPRPCRPTSRARWPRSWTGRSPGTRPSSSPAPPSSWTPPRPVPPRARFWTGPDG